MTNRRERGQGSIRKRVGHPATAWQGQIRIDGRRLSVYGATRQEVADKLDRERRRAREGLRPTDERTTLAAFVATWLKAPPGKPIRARTLARYEQLLRLHVLPVIGPRKLSQLRPEDVRAVLDRMRRPRAGRPDGLHPRTIIHARAALRRVLRDALRDGRVSRNVATGEYIDVETPERRKIRPLSIDAARRLLDVVRGDRLGPVYAFALATGARLGEVTGLRWRDVRWEGGLKGSGEIDFVQTVIRAGEAPEFGRPKNDTSSRTLAMTAGMRAALLDQRQLQDGGLTGAPPKLLVHAGGGCPCGVKGRHAHGALVFTATDGGPLAGTYVTQHLGKLLTRAGLPKLRFHDLRHAFASFAYEEEGDLLALSEHLGHSSPRTTQDVYVHVFEERKHRLASRLDKLFVVGG